MMQRSRMRYWFPFWVGMVLALSCGVRSGASSIGSDPYRVLGVSKDCTQDDIRRRYRQLCLELHPDKNVHKSESDRSKCEERFKQIQNSYSQISTPLARQRYDASTRLFHTPQSASASASASSGSDFDDLFRSMMSGQSFPFFPTATATARRRSNISFHVNGVDMSHLFSEGSRASSSYFFDNTNTNTPLPVFVQHISVPLCDLYMGVDRMEFVYTQKGGWISQCKAAWKGGLIRPIFLQSCVAAVPVLMRTLSWKSAGLVFLLTFLLQLPTHEPPIHTVYTSPIQSGWKAGTKVTFQQPNLYSVQFILQEQSHPNYTRIGNNLHTTLHISHTQAKHGCTAALPSFSHKSTNLSIYIPPNTQHNQILTIPNKGWPIRNNNHNNNTNNNKTNNYHDHANANAITHGDIMVKIKIQKDDKKENKKKKKKRKRKTNKQKKTYTET